MSKPLRLFNLDLHISVIEDIQEICKSVFGDQIEITNWSISGHNWVFQKPTPHVQIINQHTWKGINRTMIEQFQEMYDSFLEEFDGFIVTHTPVFALLFEKYKKPILVVNTCRYDQPFCWTKDGIMKQDLDVSLRRMVETKQCSIVSNNLADYQYLLAGTGIKSAVLPSLCLYTNTKYHPTKAEFVIYGRAEIFPKHQLLAEKPKSGYSWKDLYEFRGIVHTPYEMSTMSIFEQFWAGVPLFFPSKRFYKECMIEGKMEFISPYAKWNEPLTEAEIDGWLKAADFYRLPFIHHYDSFEDLQNQLENFKDEHYHERLVWLEQNISEIKNAWRTIFVELYKNTL